MRFNKSRPSSERWGIEIMDRIREPIYFGCHGQPGHYVWTAKQGLAERDYRWLTYFDGLLVPDDLEETQGLARLHIWNRATAIAFWDRSVDKRPNSNSAFFIPNQLTFEQAVAVAQEVFPWVWERFTFKVRLAKLTD